MIAAPYPWSSIQSVITKTRQSGLITGLELAFTDGTTLRVRSDITEFEQLQNLLRR